MKDLLEQQELLSGRMPAALKWLYLILIALAILGFAATWYIFMDVVVNANGIIRPFRERTSVRTPVAGTIDSIWIREGQYVREGERLAALKDERQQLIALKLKDDLSRKQELLNDLNKLILIQGDNDIKVSPLGTAVYREQFALFAQQLEEKKIILTQSRSEFDVARKLINDRIIAPAEYDARKSVYQQRSAILSSALHQQLATWNRERQEITEEINDLNRQLVGLAAEQENLHLFAPVSGFVMGLQEHYSGSFLQSGEVFCVVSPEDSLVAECLVQADKIGFLQAGQKVVFKVAAFDHKQFGIIHGTIKSIDNDFSIINEMPVYKIRCSLSEKTLSLRNGYVAKLKKGMSLDARVIITRRTVWQLFTDRLHNWFVPVVSV